MLDMVRLALETDSSRVITFYLDATSIHPLTHHGNRPEVLEELRKIEESQFVVLNNFLNGISLAATGPPSGRCRCRRHGTTRQVLLN